VEDINTHLLFTVHSWWVSHKISPNLKCWTPLMNGFLWVPNLTKIRIVEGKISQNKIEPYMDLATSVFSIVIANRIVCYPFVRSHSNV